MLGTFGFHGNMDGLNPCNHCENQPQLTLQKTADLVEARLLLHRPGVSKFTQFHEPLLMMFDRIVC